jgi:hypothetical protein
MKGGIITVRGNILSQDPSARPSKGHNFHAWRKVRPSQLFFYGSECLSEGKHEILDFGFSILD